MAPGGLVEMRVSWPGHPRYLKKREGRTRLAQGSAITRRGLKAQLAFPHWNLGLGSSAFRLEYGHPIPTMRTLCLHETFCYISNQSKGSL